MSFLELIVGVAAARALNAIPVGLLIAALAWLLQRLLAKRGSALRFSIWFAALLVIAGLPFFPRFANVQASAPVHVGVTLSNSWAFVVMAVWAAITGIYAIRVGLGLLKLRRLRKNSVPLDLSQLPPELQQTAEECNSARSLLICASFDVRVPTAIGFLRPTILIPEWTLRELPVSDLKAVILHEFAHLQRRDDWTNLAQKAIRALFFFHPAVWWIERRLSMEREVACDELVLAKTGDARAYAECLVSLAEKGIMRRSVGLAQAAVSHVRELSQRLSRILARANSSAPFAHKPRLGLVGISALLVMASVSGSPEWIHFQAPDAQVALKSAPEALSMSNLAAEKRTAEIAEPQPATLRRKVRKHPQVLNASHKVSHPDNPVVVKTSARGTTPAPQFLVLTQTTRYDVFGDPQVSFTLWRVTMPHGKQGAAQAEVIARSL